VRAPADGYTLFLANAANAINATLYEINFIRDIASSNVTLSKIIRAYAAGPIAAGLNRVSFIISLGPGPARVPWARARP
jgi:hypothetical protein